MVVHDFAVAQVIKALRWINPPSNSLGCWSPPLSPGSALSLTLGKRAAGWRTVPPFHWRGRVWICEKSLLNDKLSQWSGCLVRLEALRHVPCRRCFASTCNILYGSFPVCGVVWMKFTHSVRQGSCLQLWSDCYQRPAQSRVTGFACLCRDTDLSQDRMLSHVENDLGLAAVRLIAVSAVSRSKTYSNRPGPVHT